MAKSVSALESGVVLNSGAAKYRIISVLGQGGFGITYLAVAEIQVGNVPTEAKFAVKEHFPAEFCVRSGEFVVPKNDKLEEYSRSKSDFISEAKKLHALGVENDNIVKVNEVFEANGTAYYIMQYINGSSLRDYVKKRGKLSYIEAIKLLDPIFDSVQFLHKSRINHLDIKPENIMLHDGINGLTPVLIDFGQSVHFKKNGSKTSPKGLLGVSEGYSPLEQYAGITEFNPATDIYSLAATLMYALTGEDPLSASKIKLDVVRSALAKIVPDEYIEGICKALNKSDDDRTSSIFAFKSNLGIVRGNSGRETHVIGLGDDDPWYKKYCKYIVSAFLIVAIVCCCIFLPKSCNKETAEPVPNPPEMTDSVAKDTTRVSESVQEPKAENDNEKKASTETSSDHFAITQGQSAKHDHEPVAPKPEPKSKVVKDGTLQLGYGTWTGGIKNGKMDGKGTIVFNSTHRIPGSSNVANPGERLEATFVNGQFERGKLYDADGNLLKTIL